MYLLKTLGKAKGLNWGMMHLCHLLFFSKINSNEIQKMNLLLCRKIN